MRSAARRACVDVGQQAGAGQQRHARSRRQLARRVLEAERAHLLRRRADERDARRLAARRRTRRSRSGSRSPGGWPRAPVRVRRLEDAVDVAGSSAAAGAGPMQTASSASPTCSACRVGLGVHRDRATPMRAQRPDDAAGDLAAVGDQDFVEHGRDQAAFFQTSTSIGRRVVGVARVVELRAVARSAPARPSRRASPRSCPGAETPSSKVSSPVGRHRHVHEEVDVAAAMSRLLMPRPVARDRQQEAVAAAVHVLLLDARSAPCCSRPRRRRPACRGGRRCRRRSSAARCPRSRSAACRSSGRVRLRADGVRRAVALVEIVGVVEQRVDRLVALEVDDAEESARARARASSPGPAGT